MDIYYGEEKWQKQVGERMREVRIQRNFTLEELSNRSGLDVSQLNRMELGKVEFSFVFLRRLSIALEVHPAIFLT